MSAIFSDAGRAFPSRTVAFVALLLITVCSCGLGDDDSDASDALVGTWTPAEVPSVEFGPAYNPKNAQITFTGDGKWTASDSCNDLSGTYTLGSDGAFEMETRGSAGVGCNGGEVPYELLLAQTSKVDTSGDGEARFESPDGKLLLALEAA